MGNVKPRFGMKAYSIGPAMWSFSIGLSHWGPEIYLHINFLYWTVAIGRILIFKEEK